MKHVYQHDNTQQTAANHFGTVKLTLSRLKIKSTKPAVEHEIACTTSFTAGELLDLIWAKQLQYYKFHQASSGCLHWQLSLMDLLASKGWIQACTDDIKAKIVEFRSRSTANEENIPFPPVRGEYYDPKLLVCTSRE